MEPDWGLEYAHLSRTRAYVASLPRGLASYPECRSKWSIWKNIRQWTDTARLAGSVPPELKAFAPGNLLDAAWLPAVESFAGHLALRDALFPTDEAMVEHFRMLDRRLLAGRLYRMLFAVTTPELVVHAADRKFRAMFEGIALDARPEAAGRVRLSLRYPPLLLPPLVGRLYLVAFEVAVELAGARDVRSRVLDHGAEAASYELTWGRR